MRNIIHNIKNAFKVAKLLLTDDSGILRFYTVSTMGKQQKVLGFSPYGLIHNPPQSSLSLVWSQQGQESNGIAIADDPNNRTLKNLLPGEVAVSNYTTGDYVVFKDGNIIEVSGSDINVTADRINITCQDVNIDGNLAVGGIDYLTHVHEQGPDSDGDSEVDTEYPKSGV